MSDAPARESPAPAPARAAASASASAWAPFRHRTFAVIWVATVVSNIGGWMYSVAIRLADDQSRCRPSRPCRWCRWRTICRCSCSPFRPARSSTSSTGALFLIVGETAVTVTSTAFAALVWLHLITPGSLLWFSFLVTVASAVTAPAWQAVVPQLVPKAELPGAIAANSVGINVSRAVGPALGGLMVVAFGIAAPFWVNAVSNVGVIAALIRWRPPKKSGPTLPPETFGQAMRSGLRHARYNASLRSTLVRTVAFFVFASAYWALLPLVARNQIAGSPGALRCAARRDRRIGRRGRVSAANAALAIWDRTRCSQGRPSQRLSPRRFLASRTTPASHSLASVLAGASWIAGVSSLNVSAQVALPEWVRGRGLSMYVTVMFGSLSLGSATLGRGGEARMGLPLALYAAAAGAVLAIPLTWRWKLQTGAAIDFTPSMHWPEPVTTAGVEPDRGPVLTLVEYRIDPQHREAFLQAMGPYARVAPPQRRLRLRRIRGPGRWKGAMWRPSCQTRGPSTCGCMGA